MANLSGKTALVAGASHGIGRASALAFGKASVQVLVHCDRAASEAHAMVNHTHHPGPQAPCRDRDDRNGTTVRGQSDLNVYAAHTFPARILIAGDDPATKCMVGDYLVRHRMRAVWASGQPEVIRDLAVHKPDFIILDLSSGNDGADLLREIRLRSNIPVIVAADERTSEIDRVVALELGADDYVVKPFSLRELLARIRAVLRRQAAGRTAALRDRERGRWRFGGWELDRRTQRLTDPSGTRVSLSKREYALLTAFLDAPQRPLSREYLLQATRMHEDIVDRTIDVQILRLRRKLGTDPTTPQIIQTERGVGYVFALAVEPL